MHSTGLSGLTDSGLSSPMIRTFSSTPFSSAWIVSPSTTRITVAGWPVGPLEVKGKRDPVTAYEVLGPAETTTPMAIAAERGLTPFVGRSEELTQLEAAYRRLASGAQVVAIVGPAGAGKSRLIYEFKQRLGDGGTRHHAQPLVREPFASLHPTMIARRRNVHVRPTIGHVPGTWARVAWAT